nr:nuclease-related domain-containing protein [Luteibacter sp. Sphag1AF]
MSVYVDEAIEHASERDVLAALVDSLLYAGTGASIFANFHIGGRQMDCLIATDALTLVVEAKHFSRRVRGKVNGLWQMRAAGSVWKHVGNSYLQHLARSTR